MTGRLPAGLTVSALVRRTGEEGGFAAVRARGDAEAGAILVVAPQRGGGAQVFERGVGPSGDPALMAVLASQATADDAEDYWRRRRARDPDLWVVELDVPDAERLIAETMGLD